MEEPKKHDHLIVFVIGGVVLVGVVVLVVMEGGGSSTTTAAPQTLTGTVGDYSPQDLQYMASESADATAASENASNNLLSYATAKFAMEQGLAAIKAQTEQNRQNVTGQEDVAQIQANAMIKTTSLQTAAQDYQTKLNTDSANTIASIAGKTAQYTALQEATAAEQEAQQEYSAAIQEAEDAAQAYTTVGTTQANDQLQGENNQGWLGALGGIIGGLI